MTSTNTSLFFENASFYRSEADTDCNPALSSFSDMMSVLKLLSGCAGCAKADIILRIISMGRPARGNVEPATWCPGHLWLESGRYLICLKHCKGSGMRKMFLDSKAPWSDIDLCYIMLQWSCRFWI